MNTITMDRMGDLVLELGDQRLLVSSTILTLVSPVFEAMFKPTFKEGIGAASSIAPYAIPLPEDDPEAFILFCRVIHHRTNEVQLHPSPFCLENQAFICDKYQCKSVLAPMGVLWLQRLFKNATQEDLHRLLLFAYVLDLAEPFWLLSGKALSLQVGDFIDLPVLSGHYLINHNLLRKRPLLSFYLHF